MSKYGIQMMQNVRKHNFMPEEIYSEKNRMADDGSLAKVLFYDIVRQTRLPAGLASVDASNCYDSIAHAIASLVFQSFGVSEEAVTSMLEAIQEMKFYLRTAFGDSKTCAGSEIQVKTQGLCQGNGASPAGWAVISITILNAHKKKGHGAQIVCPISNLKGHLAAILYVDDADVVHLRMEEREDAVDSHSALQESVINWGRLLIATGGALKPAKCFYHLISFDFKPDGRWSYAKNELNEDFDVVVPMPDGGFTAIEHLSVDTASKTLGVKTCPSGKAEGALERIRKRAQEWVDLVKNGKMHRRQVWFSVDRQFWPKVGYGLSSVSATFAQLESSLKGPHYQLLPYGGVIRTCKAPFRQLDRGFYGVGLPHVGIENLVECSNKLLMHYGCSTGLGLKMQTSMELLITELGLSFQPFSAKYSLAEKWVTFGWLKMLWEKIDKFGMEIRVNNVELGFGREEDSWLMESLLQAGYSEGELVRLNRVRIHQQVLFLPDVLCAKGKKT